MKGSLQVIVADDGKLRHSVSGDLNRKDLTRIKRAMPRILAETYTKYRREAIAIKREQRAKAAEIARQEQEKELETTNDS